MASGLTQILLTKKLQDKLPEGELKNILAFAADPFQVGAVAPDLPYASIADYAFFSNESPLADDYHYKRTNHIPLKTETIKNYWQINFQVRVSSSLSEINISGIRF